MMEVSTIKSNPVDDAIRWMVDLADGLAKAERITTGTAATVEGHLIVQMSNELVEEIELALRRHAKALKGFG